MTNWVETQLAGWGRFPVVEAAQVSRPERIQEVVDALNSRDGHAIIAHGLGRSYGDAALLKDGRVILTRRLDRMLRFDDDTGWLRVESGVSLKEIIETFLPRGWFPPVVPGTQFVTVGGALGCNIHGKSHREYGCFGDHVRRVELLTATGDIVLCDRENEPELFWATVGGMGLTGFILSLEMQLIEVPGPAIEMETVRVEDLDQFFAVSEEETDLPLSMGWIDCVKTGAHMGRGIYMRGRHADAGARIEPNAVDRFTEMVGQVVDGRDLESNLWVNQLTMRLFNEAYFRKEPRGRKRQIANYVPFYFPLDAVPNWNFLYGKRGFLQYQLVVTSEDAVRACLDEISRSGYASFLAVIKKFGDRDHGGLSFPMGGTTLALDFPNVGDELFRLFERLDAIVLEDRGRVYLGKDARLPKSVFRAMYPEWERWKAVRDTWDPDGVFKSELSRRLGLTS